jgi:hypothetical protein
MNRNITRYVAPLAATLLSLSLIACSSQRQKAEPSAAEVAARAAKGQPGPQSMGYSVVSKNGEPVYCKRTSTTGSNLVRVTRCLTAQEWARARDNDQQALDEMRRQIEGPPPR